MINDIPMEKHYHENTHKKEIKKEGNYHPHK